MTSAPGAPTKIHHQRICRRDGQAVLVETTSGHRGEENRLRMNTAVVVPLAGLALLVLLRPWRSCEEQSREASALIAASLSGLIFLSLCAPI